jgi:hypothetical protein
VPHVPDPSGEDWHNNLAYTLTHGGDCEDLAALLAALYREAGFDATLTWMPLPDEDDDHVTVEVRVAPGAAPVWAEPLVIGAALGEHPVIAAHRLGQRHRVGRAASGALRPRALERACATCAALEAVCHPERRRIKPVRPVVPGYHYDERTNSWVKNPPYVAKPKGGTPSDVPLQPTSSPAPPATATYTAAPPQKTEVAPAVTTPATATYTEKSFARSQSSGEIWGDLPILRDKAHRFIEQAKRQSFSAQRSYRPSAPPAEPPPDTSDILPADYQPPVGYCWDPNNPGQIMRCAPGATGLCPDPKNAGRYIQCQPNMPGYQSFAQWNAICAEVQRAMNAGVSEPPPDTSDILPGNYQLPPGYCWDPNNPGIPIRCTPGTTRPPDGSSGLPKHVQEAYSGPPMRPARFPGAMPRGPMSRGPAPLGSPPLRRK